MLNILINITLAITLFFTPAKISTENNIGDRNLSVTNSQGLNCKMLITELFGNYTKRYNAVQCSYVIKNYNIINGVKGEEISTNVWTANKKVKMENRYFTMYSDEANTVFISQDAHTISIKKNDKNNKDVLGSTLTSAQQADSLSAYASDIKCGSGELTMIFPAILNKKPNPLKKIIVSYSSTSFEIEKISHYYDANDKSETISIVSYSDYKTTVQPAILEGSAVSHVMNGKNKLEKYKNYQLTDLR